ncbi:hypothetical protein HN937_16955 [Candidatus Poribacteria bacterium]|nr:hypothetical protein [Candidatus Poribacteria bacterium]
MAKRSRKPETTSPGAPPLDWKAIAKLAGKVLGGLGVIAPAVFGAVKPEADTRVDAVWERYTQPALDAVVERLDELEHTLVDVRIAMAELRAERDGFRRAAKRYKGVGEGGGGAAFGAALGDVGKAPTTDAVDRYMPAAAAGPRRPLRAQVRLPERLNLEPEAEP